MEKFGIKTNHTSHMVDISYYVNEIIKNSSLKSGICNIFIAGATGAITTIEFEPGLQKDFPAMLERIAPENIDYEHHKTWGDYNGSGHCRASLLGPSLTVPFSGGSCILGTWQQIIFIELDSHGRNRTIYVTLIGE
ncbi:MAG: YjbQ family protein [Candidatus Lokiarchaeota archaeon]|nr:YjbQ family protein [Candidatus Lokiarchaeota archaeon]